MCVSDWVSRLRPNHNKMITGKWRLYSQLSTHLIYRAALYQLTLLLDNFNVFCLGRFCINFKFNLFQFTHSRKEQLRLIVSQQQAGHMSHFITASHFSMCTRRIELWLPIICLLTSRLVNPFCLNHTRHLYWFCCCLFLAFDGLRTHRAQRKNQ